MTLLNLNFFYKALITEESIAPAKLIYPQIVDDLIENNFKTYVTSIKLNENINKYGKNDIDSELKYNIFTIKEIKIQIPVNKITNTIIF